ncbi:threonine/serine exporter family protein [Microbacterium horticulturae]|uniref:Threonine/serine exporter family protein n=1 Tax=Microbacterium horticulturae TaxID=3028316 RepID=A0ABY8C2D0_9MICO|nr:threonine/serine exporter family protein [Microbacterium sp. KACC 23027]WEG08778.1 threonine/serine exporter family protein [Microbacterium sp. KACC 23027]
MTREIESEGRLRMWWAARMRAFTGEIVRTAFPPTQRVSIPWSADALSQRHARAVIDLCLRSGEAMLATGATTADVVATVLRISGIYGLMNVHVDIAFTSITISVHRGLDEDPISIMRVVKVRTIDYTRLQAVYRLIDEIVTTGGAVDVDDARDRLSTILNQPHPYRRWVVTLGMAVLAGGVVVMFNASLVLALVAAASAVVADLIGRRLAKWGIAVFFSQIACAAAITAIAVFMYSLRSMGVELPGANHPTVIVISGIIMLLSGIGLTTAARDAVDGYYLTAAARTMEVVMLTLGLAIGIWVTIGVAFRLGVPASVGTSLGSGRGLWAGMLGVALIGIGFALTSYVRFGLAPLMAADAVIVFAVYYLLRPLMPQPGLAAGIAGAVAGIIAYLAYRWIKVPEAAMAMAGIIGLIPGLAFYQGLYALIGDDFEPSAAAPALLSAAATGLGLAAGTAIGGYIARLSFGLDRSARIAQRRGRVRR